MGRTAFVVLLMATMPASARAQSSSAAAYSEAGANVLPAPSQGVEGSSESATTGGGGTPNGGQPPGGGTPAASASATNSSQNEAPQAGELPFTGSDIGYAMLVGALLLALGLALRRTTRNTS